MTRRDRYPLLVLAVVVGIVAYHVLTGLYDQHLARTELEEYLDRQSHDPAAQVRALDKIPLNRAIRTEEMEKYLLFATGWYIELDSLATVRLKPMRQDRIFAFEADLPPSSLRVAFLWKRTQ